MTALWLVAFPIRKLECPEKVWFVNVTASENWSAEDSITTAPVVLKFDVVEPLGKRSPLRVIALDDDVEAVAPRFEVAPQPVRTPWVPPSIVIGPEVERTSA